MRARPFPLSLAAALAAPAAVAQTAVPPPAVEPPAQIERFSMTPTEGGFLRLDKQSGAVSFCTVEAGAAACRAGADERAALEKEIAELKRENAELKAGRDARSQSSASPLPREEEFERALSFAERFIRRIVRALKEESSGDRI
jgi:chorismate mutase